MKREGATPVVVKKPLIDVPDSMISFLSASAAAGNAARVVVLRGSPCPDCGEASLKLRLLRRPASTTQRVPRPEYDVVARCDGPSCSFQGPTNRRITLS